MAPDPFEDIPFLEGQLHFFRLRADSGSNGEKQATPNGSFLIKNRHKKSPINKSVSFQ